MSTDGDAPDDTTEEGAWVECTEQGICDQCMGLIRLGDRMLQCNRDGRGWEAYCSEECRDARQTVLQMASDLEDQAERLRNG